MIIRVFTVKVRPGCEAEWQDKVKQFSIPWIASQPGVLSYYPGKPLDGESRVFSMTSVWENLEAIQKAVGDDWQQVVLLEDEASLVEDRSVEHYEVFGKAKTRL